MSHKNLRSIFFIFTTLFLPLMIICSDENEMCLRFKVKVRYFRRAIKRNYYKTVESSYSSEFIGKLDKFEQGVNLGMDFEGLSLGPTGETQTFSPEIGANLAQTYQHNKKHKRGECFYLEKEVEYQDNTMQIFEQKKFTYQIDDKYQERTVETYVDSEIIRECTPPDDRLRKLAEQVINNNYDCTDIEEDVDNGKVITRDRSCSPADHYSATVCRRWGKYIVYSSVTSLSNKNQTIQIDIIKPIFT